MGPVMEKSSSPDAKKESQLSLVIYTVVALGLALVIRFFIAAPYVVSGSSMEPNFQDWNYLIVDRISYDLETPQRGDVIVLNLPQDTSRALIKRVIGLPGDTLVISGSNPTITIVDSAHPQGFTLSEPYIDPADYGGPTDMRVTLGADQYFVLGDNRGVSADSRTWGILPRQDIVGRVFLRLYPFNELGILPEEARYPAATSGATTQTNASTTATQ
jgi:signal peptidase I